MNNVCTAMLHMNNKKIKTYNGNFDLFLKAKEDSKQHQEKNYQKEQADMNKMKEFINKFGHGTAKLARQAQSREKALKRMVVNGLTEKVDKDYQFEFGFPWVDDYQGTMMEIVNVDFGYTADKILYQNLNFAVDMDTRIALVGANGVGKSTFLKILLQEVKPLKGKVKHEKVVRFAYYHQHLSEHLPGEMTPLD